MALIKGYMTVSETAEYLGVSEFLVTKLVDNQGLPAVNVGQGDERRRLRIPVIELDIWLSGRRAGLSEARR